MSALRKTISLALLGCIVGGMSGCVSSSSLADIWHDPSYAMPPLQKILVIAVRKDATKRRIFEDAFAGELVRYGVAAEPSYGMFPDAPPDTNQVIQAVLENGFGGIMAIFTLPAETNTRFIKGYTSYEPEVRYRHFKNPYWQRYWSYYREIEHPGYTDSQTVDIRAIDVTTTGSNGRLIWSATSRTPDPGSVVDVQRGIAGLVMEELAKRSMIAPGK